MMKTTTVCQVTHCIRWTTGPSDLIICGVNQTLATSLGCGSRSMASMCTRPECPLAVWTSLCLMTCPLHCAGPGELS